MTGTRPSFPHVWLPIIALVCLTFASVRPARAQQYLCCDNGQLAIVPCGGGGCQSYVIVYLCNQVANGYVPQEGYVYCACPDIAPFVSFDSTGVACQFTTPTASTRKDGVRPEMSRGYLNGSPTGAGCRDIRTITPAQRTRTQAEKSTYLVIGSSGGFTIQSGP